MTLNLYTLSVKKDSSKGDLTQGEITSVVYHDIFDYPMDFKDLIKWRAADGLVNNEAEVVVRGGHVFKMGREGLVYKKQLRYRISQKKLQIAKKSSFFISKIPFIKMIGVTGSLAMNNSTEQSDIDLLVITERNRLWITRLVSIFLLKLFNIPTRRSGDPNQKDKICLNMWLDEDSLVWKKERNLYTAHEIAQVKALFNKGKTYEKFLKKNMWILNYWPNSVKIENKKNIKEKFVKKNFLIKTFDYFENIAYQFQYKRMKNKITHETVGKKIALFHPQDWGEVVLTRLSS